MMLVTGLQPGPCDNPLGDHYLLKSTKKKQEQDHALACRVPKVIIVDGTPDALGISYHCPVVLKHLLILSLLHGGKTSVLVFL